MVRRGPEIEIVFIYLNLCDLIANPQVVFFGSLNLDRVLQASCQSGCCIKKNAYERIIILAQPPTSAVAANYALGLITL